MSIIEKAEIKNIVKDITRKIVDKKYDLIYNDDYIKEMSAEQMSEIVNDYGGVFTMPPDISFEQMEVYEISSDELSLDYTLWCNNEKSDLTLICRLKVMAGKIRYTVEDIHIL